MVEYRSLFMTIIGGVKLKKWRKVILFTVMVALIAFSTTFAFADENESEYEHNYNLGQFHLIEGQFDRAIPFLLMRLRQSRIIMMHI